MTPPPEERERQLERFTTIIDAVGDGIYQLDTDGRFIAVNDVVTEVTGYSRDALIGEPVSMILDDDSVQRSLELIQELVTADEDAVRVIELQVHTTEGDVIPVEARIALIRSDGDIQGTVGVVRDVSERKQREAELERQRNELAELNRLNAVIRDINQTLVTATTRAEIERTVCERLAGSDSYVFVWIGAHHPGRGTVEPHARVGVAEDHLDDLPITLDDSETERGPTGKAIRSGSVHVAQDLLEDPEYEPWRDAAREYGFKSTAAIPIEYGETVYGTINLYADRAYGFSDREIEVLNELGDSIGLAINAVENRRLLHADTAVSLEFRITDSASFFIQASRDLACTIQLEGVVPAEESTFLYYLSVDGATAAAVRDLTAETAQFRDVHVISELAEGCVLLVQVAGSSALLPLMEAGARIESAVADKGEGTVVAQVAPDANVRTIVESVQRVVPESELISRQEVDLSVQTSQEFRTAIKDRLTDKQLAVLEATYRAGYFTRPRTVTGGDLAESFGVTPSTFHHHLQAGLNKTVGAVFDT